MGRRLSDGIEEVASDSESFTHVLKLTMSHFRPRYEDFQE